jgi:hypothetical protein
MANPPEAVGHDLPTTSGEVSGSGPGEYLGYDVRETAGSSGVTVVLYDNASAASGTILDEIVLAANGVSQVLNERPGKQVVHGIYAAISGSGTLQGAVYQ